MAVNVLLIMGGSTAGMSVTSSKMAPSWILRKIPNYQNTTENNFFYARQVK